MRLQGTLLNRLIKYSSEFQDVHTVISFQEQTNTWSRPSGNSNIWIKKNVKNNQSARFVNMMPKTQITGKISNQMSYSLWMYLESKLQAQTKEINASAVWQ